MNQILLVAIGGAIGSVFRYEISTGVYKVLGHAFPYGTLVVNVVGSFLAGVVFVALVGKLAGFSEQLRALLLIGFLGGFTTFSAFSLDTILLVQKGELASALLNMALSLALCLGATGLGVLIARRLVE